MFSDARTIATGDVVIIWFTRDSIQHITIEPGKDLHGRFGLFRHSDLIGVPYGSKVASKNNKGFIHVLRPTPELWTLALPHRTQILYVADIAFITSWLGIRPGSVVIEAGTGSGSFSHSVARTIGPRGHLHSFEFHEARMTAASEEFKRHGMSDRVTLKHRNVIRDGFELDGVVDAVFLDLPAPWDAITSAKKAMKKDQLSRICCFSPCMEQVLRTVSALNDAGFTGITMYETLLRQHEVYAFQPMKTAGEASERLKVTAIKKEERRQRQIAESKKVFEARKRAEQGQDESMDIEPDTNPSDQPPPQDPSKATKRKRGEDTPPKANAEGPTAGAPTDNSEPALPIIPEKRLKLAPATPPQPAAENQVSSPSAGQMSSLGPQSISQPVSLVPEKALFSRPVAEARGHTSYLTFAYLLPAVYPGMNNLDGVPGSSTSTDQSTVSQPSALHPDTLMDNPELEDEFAALDDLVAAASQEDIDRLMEPPAALGSSS